MFGIWNVRRRGQAAPDHVLDLLSSLFMIAFAVEARDPYTGGHLWRVSQYSGLIATRLGLDDALAARVSLGGFLHDLGKIGVPDEILNKPGRLTDEEYDVMKTHPERGAMLLTGHPLGRLVEDAVLRHHERPDGKGYPQGISGDRLSIEARIVGVADAFDAMTSHRPYRAAMAAAKALEIVGAGSGTQFDTDCADALVALADQGALTPIIGHTDTGIPLYECPVCGPTIVVHRDHRVGDHVYCPRCGNEAALEKTAEGLIPKGTGRKGTAQDREPHPDVPLMRALIKSASAHLRP